MRKEGFVLPYLLKNGRLLGRVGATKDRKIQAGLENGHRYHCLGTVWLLKRERFHPWKGCRKPWVPNKDSHTRMSPVSGSSTGAEQARVQIWRKKETEGYVIFVPRPGDQMEQEQDGSQERPVLSGQPLGILRTPGR